MPVAKLRASSTPDAMKSEGNDSLDTLIRQAIGKEPFLSISRAGDSPVQWIQLLHALDQQGTSKFSNGLKINNCIEGKELSLEHDNGLSSYASEVNGAKESVHHIKNGGLPLKGTKNASELMQSLKIPEAVVAFAQAASKANGEPEKYLPGWPLLSPFKVQMQKCDKCSREFFSPINYRRHIRVHRRSLNFDKDSNKNRDLLRAFWDKLSLDEAKEIVSFKDVTLEEVPGSSIVKALTSFIRKPGFSSLPQVHLRAGSSLLDIVQSRPSRFPISSQELFSILDDASERTFLCAGTADSMRKYVFDAEAGKIGLEVKNLVACTSFLVEQKLVKAWLADKDAEALRCQKLLVEEEEAAQKRHAELMERRRKKKLRQKGQRAKDQTNTYKANLKDGIADTLEDDSAETSSPLAASDSESHTPAAQPDHVSSFLEPIQQSNIEDEEAQSGFCNGYYDSGICQNVEPRPVQGNGRRHLVIARWQVPKSHRGAPNGFHGGHNSQVSKLGAMPKHGTHRDSRAAPAVNGNKVWTRKPKLENYGENLVSRGQKEAINQSDQNKNCEVLIGSISVTLGNCSGLQQGDSLAEGRDDCAIGHPMPKKTNSQEKSTKPDAIHCGMTRSTIKLWRPVSRDETIGPTRAQSDDREPDVNVITGKGNDKASESCLRSYDMKDNGTMNGLLEETPLPGGLRYSSHAAEAFLAQRWKEAIAADHVKLVLYPVPEPPGSPEVQNDCQAAAAAAAAPPPPPPPLSLSGIHKRSILENAENRLANNVGALESSSSGLNGKAKFRTKSEKGVKLKYIPKLRRIT